MSKEIMVRLELGSASVMFMAEGVAYNPDVADDMMKRAQECLNSAVDMAVNMGVPQGWTDVEDDDICTCEDEDCECVEGECECSDTEKKPAPRQLTEREFIDKLLRELDNGN